MAKRDSTDGTNELPAFILARNQQALAAGLSIEKLTLNKGKLSTAYTGLAEQFIATGWMRESDKFLQAVNAPTQQPNYPCRYTLIFSPASIWPNIRRWQGKALRMTITREAMPLRVWEPHKGVTAYEFFDEHIECGLTHTYVAPRDTLINAGIVADHLFDGHSWDIYEHDGRKAWLSSWHEDEGTGLMVVSLYPDNIEWARQMKKAKAKAEYASADEWRKAKLCNLEICGRLVTVETACRNGFVYSFPDEVLGEIQRHLSEVEGLITHCTINSCRDPDLKEIAQAKNQLEADIAKRDKGFKKFLASAMQASNLDDGAGKQQPGAAAES